ncbi:MAG: cysteine desulfurase [Verrucomicrobiota bacterium]|jgi:cysteine desulfurase/selenocysteine lyase|nr:cysteine desulfurase [Verrucomicrobiota bacterium]MDP6251993.1 cysteine desulfurase [Verrucomicrobiota bacterium]MDP7176881.1 cysteine desulfurase [Verrucomicrobiota bacterium]MDP7291648.1 cysteine desulfurase [Verrucomicrobiota bacterium]MDP7441288.1 cysteine desulfurase [Verrucomicrobiota bacterium]|tara:strand:- start:4175 stop:5437 length:1263 start_codon:yes stop_codon:yes gene_type:complete
MNAPAKTTSLAKRDGVIDWAALREDFPILQETVNDHPLVYLDNAASSQKPRQVIDAIRHHYEHDNANVHRGIHELSNRATEAYEGARQRVADFINAGSREEIIFTRGTTEGLNLVANSWGLENLREGDTILLTEMEHHSNLVPWQLLAQRIGARLDFIEITGDDGQLDLQWLDEQLARARLLSLTHISNTMGTVNPIAEICARAREAGVVTVMDAAQSAGHAPVDVQAIGCDFLAFSGHKTCGPTGIGVLYGRRELLEAMPPYQGGGEMISRVEFRNVTFNVVPHKFEAGTPNVAGAVGLHAALDYLDAIGRGAIFEHDQRLAKRACERLAEINGIRLFGPKKGRSGVVSFVLPDAHALDLATMADQKGVALRAGHHCNQPLLAKLGVPATARASFYFYNTETEVDRFIEVIHQVRKLFA